MAITGAILEALFVTLIVQFTCEAVILLFIIPLSYAYLH